MQSFTFDYDFKESFEFDSTMPYHGPMSVESIPPNDVQGWYEKIYGGFNDLLLKFSDKNTNDLKKKFQEKIIGSDTQNKLNISGGLFTTDQLLKAELNEGSVPISILFTRSSDWTTKNLHEENLCIVNIRSPKDDTKFMNEECNLEKNDRHLSSFNDSEQKIEFDSWDIIDSANLLNRQDDTMSMRMRRWGRESDRNVFRFLNTELSSINMDLYQFLYENNHWIVDDSWQDILWEIRLNILERIIEKYNWHNTPYSLFRRLRKLVQNQSFSVRDIKLLKRVVKRQKILKCYNITELITLFPGKFECTIREEWKKYLKLEECPF